MKRDSRQAVFINWRFYTLLLCMLFIVVGLTARVVYLSVIKQSFLRHEGNTRAQRVISTPAFRGMITDRNGFPLAVSTTVYSIWINPKSFINTPENVKALGGLLDLNAAHFQAFIQQEKTKNHEFTYIKRGVEPELADKIKKLALPGVYSQEAYKRYYPEGEVAAHLIGFTNIDDQGQEGLELMYNDWLRGTPGKERVMKDRLGRVVSDVQEIQKQVPGKDLVLSIDRRIQYLAYRELLAGVQKNIAASGSVVVLDTQTGEVLAMVNQPAFNPNNRPAKQKDVYRNRAITDTFEPGSTIKAFSIATAIKSGKFTPNTVLDTSPGWMRVGRNVVRDEKNNGPLSITQILDISSNVGITKMMLSLPAEQSQQLWDLLHKVGFGQMTGINFPGEQTGSLVRREVWKPFALATLAFGYGISVTPLQLAQAYAIFANEGIKRPVTLLHTAKVAEGERVIDAKLAHQMLELLSSVTTSKGATGALARVAGYKVAGKTGTAIMAGAHGYNYDHENNAKRHRRKRYVSSFIGIAPLTHPRVVVAVIIQDPQGKYYYGASVSAPVFEKIMEGTLRILNVSPDDIDSLEKKAV